LLKVLSNKLQPSFLLQNQLRTNRIKKLLKKLQFLHRPTQLLLRLFQLLQLHLLLLLKLLLPQMLLMELLQ
jgi:hypothetical protein